jgi:fatty-acyl-CoA synthase
MGPDLGLGSWPWRRARMTPERVALVQGERSRTYRELAERTRRLASSLAALGVGRGDRVAYLGANDLATFDTLFATGLVGGVFVPLNTRLSAAELGYMLADCGASVLVHGPDTGEVLRGVVLPDSVRHVLALAPATSPVGGRDFEAAVTVNGDFREAPVGMDDPCLILYTSGTTGRPKGAVLTHGNLTFNTVNQLAHIDVLGSDRVLCIAPLFHVTGLGQVTLPTLFKGGTVVVAPRFDPGRVLAAIEAERITGFSAVPTMLQLLAEHPSWETTDVSSLRYVIYGGSAVQERVARAWLRRGVRLQQGYGMTEAAPGVYMALQDGALERPVSVGVPHFFTDIAVLHDGSPATPTPGVAAELLVRGPNVFGGYWNRPQETAASLVDGEWFRTGDVLRVGDDGWAHVVDRVKDLIISGGENVYPAEVEAVIVQRDEIASCAVVAVPDERWGEVGAAFVVLRDGAELDEPALRTHLESQLARYKVPRYLHFVPDLPVSATGKVRRVELRVRAAERLSAPPVEGATP